MKFLFSAAAAAALVMFASLSQGEASEIRIPQSKIRRAGDRRLDNIGGTAPLQSFYVPLRETELFEDIFKKINSGARAPITTMISIAVSTDNTRIWYDHWEDGFESDIEAPSQSSTEIWGDGDASNGCPPIVSSCTDANDKLKAGDVIILDNDVPVSRGTSKKYDGGDLIWASRPVAMARAAYPDRPGSLMAGAVEVFEQASWGTTFEAPIGQNVGSSSFEFVALAVMAGDEGAVIQINGRDQRTLGQGQNAVIRVNQGDQLTSTKPVQVHLITGDIGSTYELRWYSLQPTEKWSNEAYAPVGDTAGGAKVIVYNPSTSQIEVTVTTGGDSYTLKIDPKKSKMTNVIRDGNAAKFTSSNKFFAFSMTDTVGTAQIFDWGYPLMTKEMLTQEVIIGLGYGCTGNDCDGAKWHESERSVVWVTPIEDATIFVDFDNDGHVDKEIEADALDSIVITDEHEKDHDMSGAVIWATKGGRDGVPVKLAAAWGQKASLSGSGDDHALDLGTVVPPLDPIRFYRQITLVEDKDGDGEISCGDVIQEEIEVINVGQISIKENQLAVQSLGTTFNLDPMAGRGASQMYTITNTVPCDDSVNDTPQVVDYDPEVEDRAAEPEPEPKTPGPTASPSAGPTASPTVSPTDGPTVSPTASPTDGPTASPSAGPTEKPCTKVVPEPKNPEEKCYPMMLESDEAVGEACVEVRGDKIYVSIEHSSETHDVVVSQLCEEAIARGEDPYMTLPCECKFEDLSKTEWEVELPNNCEEGVTGYTHHLIARNKLRKDGETDLVEAYGVAHLLNEPFMSYIHVDVDCSCSE